MIVQMCIAFILVPLIQATDLQDEEDIEFDWESWWGYDGISGPSYWGVYNRRWRLCRDGRRQSPIDFSVEKLVYDHTLEELQFEGSELDGNLLNTRTGLRWTPSLTPLSNTSEKNDDEVASVLTLSRSPKLGDDFLSSNDVLSSKLLKKRKKRTYNDVKKLSSHKRAKFTKLFRRSPIEKYHSYSNNKVSSADRRNERKMRDSDSFFVHSPLKSRTSKFSHSNNGLYNNSIFQVREMQGDESAVNRVHSLSPLPLSRVHGTQKSNPGQILNNKKNRVKFRIEGGPLHYQYTLSHLTLRWPGSASGSEHSLQEHFFQAEVQLIFYNNILYANYSDASDKPNGIAAVAVFIKEGDEPNSVLKTLLDSLPKVSKIGETAWVPLVPIRELFTSPHYLTYDGSLTEPPCEENVTWLLLNKPAYITKQQLSELQLMRRSASGGVFEPSIGNARPTQPLHARPLRTNIPPHPQNCGYQKKLSTYYKAASADNTS